MSTPQDTFAIVVKFNGRRGCTNGQKRGLVLRRAAQHAGLPQISTPAYVLDLILLQADVARPYGEVS